METVPREEIRQCISRFQTELATNGLEDDYLVTSEGLKRLTLTEQSLI
jgi:hypothetical protein